MMRKPMTKRSTMLDVGQTLRALEVLRAVQKDTRTPGWYWGEVRGKEAIGAATTFLLRRGLIRAAVGPQPFLLTQKGKEFVGSQIKDWDAFLAKTARQGIVEKVAKALMRLPESNH
jgi:hypothetical protein